jgi:glucosamine-6-phosphate deaminase
VPAEPRVFADADELGEALAEDVLALYSAAGDRPFLLGCPGGRSLRSTYRALAARRPDLDRLVVVMMDEYVVDGAAAPADAHYSCSRFAREELIEPLGLRAEQVWLPDPADPAAYDERIEVVRQGLVPDRCGLVLAADEIVDRHGRAWSD